MIKAQRQREILQLLGGDGAVSVNDLAQRFEISPITARRDLVELQRQGLLARTHGGAVLDESLNAYARYESGTFDDRMQTHAAYKRLIAEAAARLVSDGDSLMINAGSTVTAFAQALRAHRNLHIVTNGLTVATELGRGGQHHVFVLPGVLDPKRMATVIPPDSELLKTVHAPSAFLGVIGLSIERGPLMLDPVEAAMNRAFMDNAEEVTLLIDASKFESQALYRIAPLERVHRIVTDERIRAQDLRALEARGIDVVVVSAPDAGAR